MTVMPKQPVLHILSFGYGHDSPPRADITIDVREWFRDPHVDPAMRAMTGLDPEVVDSVFAMPGAIDLVDRVLAVAAGLVELNLRTVTVAFGCVGGRHRSVVLANELAKCAFLAGCHPVEVSHLHVDRPVLTRPRNRESPLGDS